MTAIAAEVKPKRMSGRSRWRAAGNVRRARKLDRRTRPTDSNNIFRWYRSGWGRYTQADPIGLHNSVNLYAYGHGDPTGHIDPLGLEVLPTGDITKTCLRLVEEAAGPAASRGLSRLVPVVGLLMI